MVAGVGTSYAQYAGDGLRFSQTNYGSSARFKAMGNAQIGVGGDVSSLGGNPAGLGLFTKTEFSFTPEFNGSNVNSNFLGSSIATNKSQLNISQVAGIFYAPAIKFNSKNSDKGLVSTVLGVGYSRNNDYGMEINYGAKNPSNTIRTFFSELANSSGADPSNINNNSLEGMAYNSYLINYNTPDNNNVFTSNSIGNPFSPVTQNKNEIRTGGVSEFNVAAAMNISNQVYIGANLGLIGLRYISDAEFIESGSTNPYDNTNGFTGVETYKLSYLQNQETRGSGINTRLGIIVRPDDNFRIGATIQSPTWFVIDDSYSETLNNKISNSYFKNDAIVYDFTYNLRTPLKGSLGAMYIFGGQGMLSADVDFIDYSSIRFSVNENNGGQSAINDSNADVRRNYKSTVNYRLGGEVKLNPVFSLRAGYGINGSPYKNDPSNTFETKFYSGGFGYKVNNYFLDLAFQRVETNGTSSPYTLNNGTEPVANLKYDKNNFFLTFGFRF